MESKAAHPSVLKSSWYIRPGDLFNEITGIGFLLVWSAGKTPKGRIAGLHTKMISPHPGF
jgi:hypothetical protein